MYIWTCTIVVNYQYVHICTVPADVMPFPDIAQIEVQIVGRARHVTVGQCDTHAVVIISDSRIRRNNMANSL